jgi:hypothetical protein
MLLCLLQILQRCLGGFTGGSHVGLYVVDTALLFMHQHIQVAKHLMDLPDIAFHATNRLVIPFDAIGVMNDLFLKRAICVQQLQLVVGLSVGLISLISLGNQSGR